MSVHLHAAPDRGDQRLEIGTADAAVRNGQLLATNPAERAKRPRASTAPKVLDVWDAGQLSTFLAEVSTHRLFPFFRLASYTETRRGELLYLRWDNVVLDDGEPHIFIRGSVSMVRGHRVEGTTKSGRSRRVSIDPGTVEILRPCRKAGEGA